MEKRGVTPVIATVLLITIAIVLAFIIFIWARGFVSEKSEKFGEPVENSCANVEFSIDAVFDDNKIYVTNEGNVPIYGLEIRKKSSGSIEKTNGIFGETLAKGESGDAIFNFGTEDIKNGDSIIVIPLILGASGQATKIHICDNEFGREIVAS